MKVKFLPQNVEVEVTPNKSLLQIATENNLEIRSICKGVPSCAECRVRIVEGDQNVLPPQKAELNLIGTSYYIDSRRLSCQVRCFGDVTVDLTEQVEKAENQTKKIRGFRTSKTVQSHAVNDTMLLNEKIEVSGSAPVAAEGDVEGSEKPQQQQNQQRPQQQKHQHQNQQKQKQQHGQQQQAKGSGQQQGKGGGGQPNQQRNQNQQQRQQQPKQQGQQNQQGGQQGKSQQQGKPQNQQRQQQNQQRNQNPQKGGGQQQQGQQKAQGGGGQQNHQRQNHQQPKPQNSAQQNSNQQSDPNSKPTE